MLKNGYFLAFDCSLVVPSLSFKNTIKARNGKAFMNRSNPPSRDDILAAHRVPPQLMGIIPNNTGGFGDIEKAGKVFFINEILPLQQRLAEINQWLGKEVITFKPYILLEQ